MVRGLAALLGLFGVLGVAVSVVQRDDGAPAAPTLERALTATATAIVEGTLTETATPTTAATFDQYGCEVGPDGEKCRFRATYTPEPTKTPRPPEPSYAAGTRTGIRMVDQVIEAVEARDGKALANLAQILEYPCEGPKTVQPHPLRCRPGQQVGDPLRGIWVSHVEGGLWPGDGDGDVAKLAEALQNALDWRSPRLHAVYRFGPDERPWARGYRPLYAVIFTRWDSQEGPSVDSFILADRGVVGLEFQFAPIDEPMWGNPKAPGWILPRAR